MALSGFIQAATPKKVKIESRNFTQAELIARALDNEEGNIVEHRDYLKNEEEKRKRARVVRATVEGPLLRWVSRGEEIKVVVPPPTTSYSMPQPNYPYGSFNSASGSMPYGQNYSTQASQIPSGTYVGALNYTPVLPGAATTTTSSFQLPKPPAQSQFEPTNYISYSPQVNASLSRPPTVPAAQPVAPAPQPAIPAPPPATPAAQPMERREKVAKNYVIHELSQHEGVPKAPWIQTMSAMFGDHVKWDELRVYTGRGRPLSMLYLLVVATVIDSIFT
jgi:hypothetical protein